MKITRPGYASVVAIIIALVVFLVTMVGYGELTSALVADPPFVLEVRPGESFSQVSRRLAAEHGLSHSTLFYLYALVRGDTSRIRAGDYAFTGKVTPGALLYDLVAGKGTYAAITVPEGINLKEIAQRVEELGLGNASEFLRLAHDPSFITALNLPFAPRQASLEGFIFPDTYYIHRAAGEAALLTTMVREFKRKAGTLLLQKAAAARLTPYDALILASIIEKETGVEAERPLVSAVFHNRLKTKMRLASDPTVIYGIADFDGNLTRAHLKAAGPYNTYVNFGLPPTPITSPGLASIKAAVDPAMVDYLFFVAKGDGTGSHFFSKDYATHEKAVDRYQRQPNRRRRT